MFYEKTCNFWYESNKPMYHVEFLFNGKAVFENFYNNVDTCFLWAGWKIFADCTYKPAWDTLRITDCDNEVVHEIHLQDELVERIWRTLTDIPVDEDECLEMPWFTFDKGTFKEDIWHWFDDRHTKGVFYLLYCLED